MGLLDGNYGSGLLGGMSGSPDMLGAFYGNLPPDQLAALRTARFNDQLAAMAQSFGQSAAPSRLPVTIGQVLGNAGGAMQGAGSAFDQNAARLLAGPQQLHALQNQNTLSDFDIDLFRRRQAQLGLGGPLSSPAVPLAQSGGMLSGNAGMEGTVRNLAEQPEGTTVKIPGAAGGAPMTLTSVGPAGSSGSSVNPQAAAGVNAPPPSQRSGAQPLMSLPYLFQQLQEAQTSPAGMKMVPSLLSLIEKGLPEGAEAMSDGSIRARPGYDQYQLGKSLSEKGFQQTANGTWQLAPGYAAGQGQIAGAEAWGKAPAEAWVNSMRPSELRGPGSVRYDPYTKTWVQVPNEINTVDPNSGAHFQQFTPLGLTQGSFGGPMSPLSGNAPAGGPLSGNPQPAGLPLAFRGAAPPQPGAGAYGGMSGAQVAAGAPAPANSSLPPSTGPRFQTQLSPARLQAEEGLGRDFADKDKKAYDSANTGLVSLYQMNAAADKMNQTGGWAVPGAAAPLRYGAAKFINTLDQMAGLKPTFDANAVASWENLTKETRRAGMELVNAEFGGQREAASIVQGATNAVPHDENSYLGFRLVSSSVEQAMQRQRDLYSFKADRLANNGSLLTAERDFNKANPPENYVRRAIANAVPDAAVNLLASNPDQYKADFDKKYGDGMAAYVLGGNRKGMIGIR